jgi:hypothetical protein
LETIVKGLKVGIMKTSKINLFALPSQTAILFGLISATLLGALVFGTAGNAPVPISWLPLAVIFLSLWGFLSRPERDIRRGKLLLVREQFPLTQQAIQYHSKQSGLNRVPEILLDNANEKIYTMGSFRRWYIVLGLIDAQNLETLLSQPDQADIAEAKILHELYHFKTGDYWQLGWLTELFKASFPLMFWFMAFFGGWVFLLGLTYQSFIDFSPDSLLAVVPPDLRSILQQIFMVALPSAAEMDAIRAKAADINFFESASFVFNMSLPLIFVTAILWFFYVPLVWRMREYYADAGMAQTLGTLAPIWKVFEPVFLNEKASKSTKFIERFNERLFNFDIFFTIKRFIKSFRRFSPYGRTEALLEPQTIFFSWKQVALFLGGLALVLEIFLATPLTLPLVGQNPMHFATLLVVISTAYFLLPHIVLGKPKWIDGLRIIIAVNTIRSVWLLITLGVLWGIYILQPDFLFDIIKSAIYSTARYAGNAPFEFDLLGFLISASVINLIQIPIILFTQTLGVSSLFFLFRRMLNWYSFFKTSNTFKTAVFGLTSGVSLVLFFTFLPLSTVVLTGNVSLLAKPIMMLQLFLGALIIIAGTLWFIIHDRNHYHKCPLCKTSLSMDSLLLNESCSCGHTIFSWIRTEYEDE